MITERMQQLAGVPVSEDKEVNETTFIAWFNKEKKEIDANSLWDAKQKAIKLFKVPKSKQGLLAVMSAKSYAQEQFRYESEEISEGKYRMGQKIDPEDYLFKTRSFDGTTLGNDNFVIVPRDTSGAGKQDAVNMYEVDGAGNIVRDHGSHHSLKGAIKFAKNNGIIPK